MRPGLIWQVVALALVVSACAERPRFQLGTECELATECAAPLVCRLGHCRDECRGNRDCRAGLVCLRDRGLGACELEGETCVLASDCREPLVCLMGRCTNECETDVDCPPGARCLAEPGGGQGCRDVSMMECEHNTQCTELEICAPDDRCREQCVTDRDCRDGTVCVGMEGMRVCDWPLPPVDAGDDGGADGGADGGVDGGMTVVGAAPTPLLVAGERHTCAAAGAELRCWGDDSFGQLADGTAVASSSIPRVIPSLAGTTLLAAGARHACAWNGSLWCWGENAAGQVGDDSTVRRTSPVAVTGVTSPNWLSAAAEHTCAVDAAGEVRCWGANDAGQLGDGTTTPRRVPTRTQPLAARAVEVTTRSGHSCARLADGRVQCWGSNRDGESGASSDTTLLVPTLVAGVSDAVEVLAGSNFTCARRRDGAVLCWGNNGLGQLGDGTTTSRSTPVVVAGLPPSAELAAGADHACARSVDGRVHCWGNNFFGQAAQDPTVFMGDRLLSPRLVAGVTGATEIASGDLHTCVRVAGGLQCWGWNMFGQLGNGTTSDAWMPVTVSWP